MKKIEDSIENDYGVLTESESVSRREYMQLAGVAVGSVTLVTAESNIVVAANDGYGESGYGNSLYGGGGLSISTEDATNINATSATLNGKLSNLGGADSAECYFEWRQSGSTSWKATTKQMLSSTDTYSDTLSGLSEGETYEFRAVAEVSDGGTATGSTKSFTMADDPVTVSTGATSTVSGSSATLNGSLNDIGGADSAECSFKWRAVGDSSWNETATQTLTSTGPFSADITSLSNGSDYEFRAVTAASDGDADTGSIVNFTTESDSTAPTIETYTTTEAGSPNPHLEITANWSVSDADGDLDTVVIMAIDADTRWILDSNTYGVSGTSATGTTEIKIKNADGETTDIILTVTDQEDESASAVRTVTE